MYILFLFAVCAREQPDICYYARSCCIQMSSAHLLFFFVRYFFSFHNFTPQAIIIFIDFLICRDYRLVGNRLCWSAGKPCSIISACVASWLIYLTFISKYSLRYSGRGSNERISSSIPTLHSPHIVLNAKPNEMKTQIALCLHRRRYRPRTH